MTAPPGTAAAAGALQVRPARAEDAAGVAELARQLGYPAPVEAFARRLAGYGADEGQQVLVAATGGRVVAWLHVVTVQRLESGDSAEIGGLVVDEGHRGGGIGTALVAAAAAWARRRGLPRLRVRSNTRRTEAHHFYQQRGFTVSKDQRVFDLELGEGGTAGRTGASRP